MPSPPSLFGTSGTALLIWLAIASAQLPPQGKNENKLRYRCPLPYKRIGNGCYHLSDEKLTWHDAQFACKDLGGGYLAKLDRRWKDKSIRRYLNKRGGERLERWFGTIFDFGRNTWIWGNGGEKLRYQGFSRRKPNDNYTWRCGVLDRTMRFRWGTRSCLEKKAYVCESPIEIYKLKHLRKKTLGIKNQRQRKFKNDKSNQILPEITNHIT